MKNILQKIFLFLTVFLFNWGYGQICISTDIQKIASEDTYSGINANINSLTPGGTGNDAALSSNIQYIHDNDLNTFFLLQSTLPKNSGSTIPNYEPGTLNANFSVNNLDIKNGEIVYLKVGEDNRFGGTLSTTAATITYTITAFKGNTSFNINPVNSLTSISSSRTGTLSFTAPDDIDKITVVVNASKPFNGTAILAQSRLQIQFYGIYVNPLCEPISCNEIIPVTKKYFGESISVDTNNVSSANNIIDGNITNSGIMTVGVLLGITVDGVVQINKSSNFTPGSYVGFDFTQNNLLTAASSVSFKIETLNSNNQIQETYNVPAASALITLGTSSSKILGFKTDPSKPFSRFRLTAELVGILGTYTFNINHGFVMEPCSTINELICNSNTPITTPSYGAIISGERTGISSTSGSASLADIGSAIINPENVVDNDPDNYASISSIASLGGKYNLSVKTPFQNLNATNGNSTYVGFDMETSSLIGLSLLNDIIINLYDENGNLVDTSKRETGSLIKLSLTSNNSRSIIGFVTDKVFNEAQIEINKTVSVDIGSTKIYNLIVRKLCEGPELDCNINTLIDKNNYPVSISSTTVTGVSLGGINNVNNILDGDENTYAEINITASVLSTATISLEKLLTPYPANTYVSFDVEINNLAQISVLPKFSIVLLNNGVEVGRTSGGNFLLGVTVGTSVRKTLGYLAPAAFNEIKFIYEQPIGVSLGNVKLYDLKLIKACQNPIDCSDSDVINTLERPVVINEFRTGPEGIGCVGCSVQNAENLISPNTTDYTTLNMAVGIGGSAGVSVLDLTNIYPKGTYVGFTIEDVPYLLQADVFEGFFVRTYLNGVEQEVVNDADILDLSIIFSIGTGTKNYGFRATRPFNEVKFEVFSLVSTFNTIKVYNLRIDASSPTANDGNINCINGVCVKPGSTVNGGDPTKIGISNSENTRSTWPDDIKNGFLALDSKSKGMIISRVTNSNLITEPKLGMLVYDISSKCVKLYNGVSWNCIKQSCND